MDNEDKKPEASTELGGRVDSVVMRETETLTCDGCVYGDPEGIACSRPEAALHCMADGKNFIYEATSDA
jgi:hypothetical protein